jgi:hypothetical protein
MKFIISFSPDNIYTLSNYDGLLRIKDIYHVYDPRQLNRGNIYLTRYDYNLNIVRYNQNLI